MYVRFGGERSETDCSDTARRTALTLHLMMSGLNGLEVIRQVRQRQPQVCVIVLSMHMNDAYVAEALSSGALGYVPKDASSSELLRAIRECAAGRRYLSPPLSEERVAAYQRRNRDTKLDPYALLTQRERQVFHLAAEGRTNAEIAETLIISIRTVESHRSNLMRKLGINNHAELIRYAIQRGGKGS